MTAARRVAYLGLAALALVAFSAGALVAQQDFETTEIADGVFQFRWVGHNGFFVVTPQGVIAIDPISVEAAAQYAVEIRKAAPGKGIARDVSRSTQVLDRGQCAPGRQGPGAGDDGAHRPG